MCSFRMHKGPRSTGRSRKPAQEKSEEREREKLDRFTSTFRLSVYPENSHWLLPSLSIDSWPATFRSTEALQMPIGNKSRCKFCSFRISVLNSQTVRTLETLERVDWRNSLSVLFCSTETVEVCRQAGCSQLIRSRFERPS